MRMLCARASLPGWVILLALGALLAPAGMARTVLLVALVVACIPAIITAGVGKRTITNGVPAAIDCDTTAVTHGVPAAIDAQFTAEDAMPTSQIVRRGN